jgi:outer membrane murein-binding lipoprotein Lpp
MNRRKLAIGAAVLAGCSFAGGAYAATNDSSPKQAFLNDLAARLNVSPQRLNSALQGAFLDQLRAAVKAGKLTQAQANEIEKRARLSGFVPFGIFGPRFGMVGPERFGFRHAAAGGLLRSAASYLGVSGVQLLNQLGSGKSLAQIAKAHGKTASGLESALVAAARSKLDRLRANGLISSAQERRALSRLEARIGAFVNNARVQWLAPPRGFRQFVPPRGVQVPYGPPPPFGPPPPPGPPA